jgi:hypothetical protein
MSLTNLFLQSKIRICNGLDYLLLLKAELLYYIHLLSLLLQIPDLLISLLALLINVNLLVLLMLLNLLIVLILVILL